MLGHVDWSTATGVLKKRPKNGHKKVCCSPRKSSITQWLTLLTLSVQISMEEKKIILVQCERQKPSSADQRRIAEESSAS